MYIVEAQVRQEAKCACGRILAVVTSRSQVDMGEIALVKLVHSHIAACRSGGAVYSPPFEVMSEYTKSNERGPNDCAEPTKEYLDA